MISKKTFEELRYGRMMICVHSQKEVTMLCDALKQYNVGCRFGKQYNKNCPVYYIFSYAGGLNLTSDSLYNLENYCIEFKLEPCDVFFSFSDIWEEEPKSEPEQILPKICYLLGSENNPILVNELFGIVDKKTMETDNVRISPSGNVCYPVPNDRDIVYLHNYKIYDYLINGNKNYEIVRMNNCAKIEFDKNQESVLYLYAKESYRYWFVNHNGKLLVSRSQKGEQGKKVEDFLLPDMSQFTEDNKFDAKKYFEEKSVD